MDTAFVPYQPGQKSYASRRPPEEWESWRALITSWHNEGLSRQQMCGMLFEQGFPVKHGQLVRKLTEWNMLVRNRSDPSPQSSTSSGSVRSPAQTAKVHPGHDSNNDSTAMGGLTELAPNHSSPEAEPEIHTKPVTEGMGNARDKSNSVCKPLQFDVGVRPRSNLDGIEAQTRVLQKMEAAESGLPEIDCCCGDFFKAEKQFQRWKPLYQRLLDETEPTQSLHYVRALARLCRSSVVSEAMATKLEDALRYYTELLARPRIRNDAAYAIALELAGIKDGMANPDENVGLRVAMEFFEHLEDAFQTASKTLRDKYSHLYQRLRNLSILDLKPSEDPSDWIDRRDEHRQYVDAQLLHGGRDKHIEMMMRDCQEAIRRNLVGISQYASTLKPWSYLESHTHARPHFERRNTIEIAQRISSVLIAELQQIAWPACWDRGVALVSLVFDAISLTVAQEFQERGRLRGLPNDDISNRLIAATSVLAIADAYQSGTGTVTPPTNRKLLQAIWICDPNQRLFSPQGLHIGPCRANKCWDLLRQGVKQFDRTTALIAPTALPRNLEPQASDDVSMLSSSTKSSFQKFRRLSDRLKHRGSTITAASVSSKWSGHMSIDSLTPEKVLGVGSDLLGPTLPVEEHRRLDEEAFGVIQNMNLMQSIRV